MSNKYTSRDYWTRWWNDEFQDEDLDLIFGIGCVCVACLVGILIGYWL